MYIVFIVLIILASFLLILAILAQNPKSGMAANFGVSNQVMGVRQTADFLEKSSWTLAVAIMALSLMASVAMSSYKGRANRGDRLIEQVTSERQEAIPNQTPILPLGGETPEE